jgi:hypothetical protein
MAHLALAVGAALLHRRGQNRRLRPWQQKRENAKAPRIAKSLCWRQRHCAGAGLLIRFDRAPMYPHARDLGVAWRLGVSTFLLVIPKGDEHEVMRRPPPATTRPLCGRRHVTPRIAVITWGRGQTDSAIIAK